jgi:hypothetical protein
MIGTLQSSGKCQMYLDMVTAVDGPIPHAQRTDSASCCTGDHLPTSVRCRTTAIHPRWLLRPICVKAFPRPSQNHPHLPRSERCEANGGQVHKFWAKRCWSEKMTQISIVPQRCICAINPNELVECQYSNPVVFLLRLVRWAKPLVARPLEGHPAPPTSKFW